MAARRGGSIRDRSRIYERASTACEGYGKSQPTARGGRATAKQRTIISDLLVTRAETPLGWRETILQPRRMAESQDSMPSAGPECGRGRSPDRSTVLADRRCPPTRVPPESP
jgi:hypothetical protein